MSAPLGPDVIAAGALVTRKGRRGRQLLLVHRPKYDDWSFPKGKRDPGEHVTAAAVREVLEETGVEIRLARPLRPQLYVVSGGRSKKVSYWVGSVLGDDDVSAYEANKEVDEVRWVGLDRARTLLTYTDDLEVLDDFEARPQRTSTVVVLRHGGAEKRKSWDGEDSKRPLSATGREQALALRPVLHAYGVTRVVTSTSKRCVQTVAPYADEQVLPLEGFACLSEEEFSPDALEDVAAELLGGKESAVLCTHRPVLPGLLEAFGLSVEPPLAPGELLVVHHRKGTVVATERHLVS